MLCWLWRIEYNRVGKKTGKSVGIAATCHLNGKKIKSEPQYPLPMQPQRRLANFGIPIALPIIGTETNEVDFQVNLKPKHNLIPVEREIAEQINAHATKQGVSDEKLVNFWLREKLKRITMNQ